MSARFRIQMYGDTALKVYLLAASERTDLTNLDIHILMDSYLVKNRPSPSTNKALGAQLMLYEPYPVYTRFTEGRCTSCTITQRKYCWDCMSGEACPLTTAVFPWVTSVHSYVRITSMSVDSVNSTTVVSPLPISTADFLNSNWWDIDFDPERPLIIVIKQTSNDVNINGYTSSQQFRDRRTAENWCRMVFHTSVSSSAAASGDAYNLRMGL